MKRHTLLASLLLLPLAGSLRAQATTEPAAAASVEPTTVAKMLAAVGPPASTSDADVHAFQQKFNAAFAGKPISLEAGVLIQIVTEGGGVTLISFPTVKTETIDGFDVGRSLSHATLVPDAEAAGRKLAPGDSVVLAGNCVSASVKVTVTDGKPAYFVRVTIDAATIVKSTIGAHVKKSNKSQT